MEQARRLLIATVVSTALLTAFLTVAGWLSPAEWEVHARTLTALPEAEVRARLVDEARWEAVRGEATRWEADAEGVRAAWHTVELELAPGPDGIALVQRVGEAAVSGRFTVADAGERREVRLVLRGRVESGPLGRLALRLDRHRFAERAQLELDGLLSAKGDASEEAPPVE